jgi:hypothetical protein
MNKYQKYALAIGAILILLFFGKSITKIGVTSIGLLFGFLWKGIAIAILTLYIISLFKKAGK